jgi:hypothetical protein
LQLFLMNQEFLVSARHQRAENTTLLKIEAEKGFMRTAFVHELVDPKVKINLVNDYFAAMHKIIQYRKGISLILLDQNMEHITAT